MSAEIDPLVQGGLSLTGVAGISYVVWKLYSQIKADVKTDNKGDNVDARITAFTSTLQTQLDKTMQRADQLQTAYNAVVSELASTKARAEVLASQNQALLSELDGMRKRLIKEGVEI